MKHLILVAAIALSACTSAPKTSDEPPGDQPSSAQQQGVPNLGIGYIRHAQARTRVETHKAALTPEGAQRVRDLLASVKKTLDTARDAALQGSPDAARQGLDIADIILNQLNADIEDVVRRRAKPTPTPRRNP